MIFIDAHKENNSVYSHYAVQLSTPGTFIIGDNVVGDGAVIDLGDSVGKVLGVHSFVDALANFYNLNFNCY